VKYALLIYVDPTAGTELSEAEQQAQSDEYMALMHEPGYVGGEHLMPTDSATTVRVADGQTLTTDGPFADTKEFFAGYYVFDAPDLDAAIALSSRIPAARMGTGSVEIRPVVEH
jgi:hypothetical protein